MFFVTMLEKVDKTDTGYDLGDTKIVAFFDTVTDAQDCLEYNGTYLCENFYSYALIEEYRANEIEPVSRYTELHEMYMKDDTRVYERIDLPNEWQPTILV